MSIDKDLAQAADERLAGLRELAALRAESRRAVRSRMQRRRTAGLARRHAAKLDRIAQQEGDEQREAHASADLTADHLMPVGAGGDEAGPLTVLCRSCNGRKRADAGSDTGGTGCDGNR